MEKIRYIGDEGKEALAEKIKERLPLAGGELTGDLKVGDTTIQASDGHIVLPSGVELY